VNVSFDAFMTQKDKKKKTIAIMPPRLPAYIPRALNQPKPDTYFKHIYAGGA
jgi:hypothetical protein